MSGGGLFVFREETKSKWERKPDGSFVIDMWVGISNKEHGENLPTGKWVEIEVAADGDPGANPRFSEAAVRTLGKYLEEISKIGLNGEGYKEIGYLRVSKPAHKFPVIYIFVNLDEGGTYRRGDGTWWFEYRVLYALEREQELPLGNWSFSGEWELSPFHHLKADAVSALEKSGYWLVEKMREHRVMKRQEAEHEREFQQKRQELPKTYMFKDRKNVQATFRDGKEMMTEFCGWTNDPEGKNLPPTEGGWSFEQFFWLHEYSKFTYWSKSAVLNGIAQKGYYVDWIEIPFKHSDIILIKRGSAARLGPADSEGGEMASEAQRDMSPRGGGPSQVPSPSPEVLSGASDKDVIQAALDDVFRKK
jgi:hypothetical protein